MLSEYWVAAFACLITAYVIYRKDKECDESFYAGYQRGYQDAERLWKYRDAR